MHFGDLLKTLREVRYDFHHYAHRSAQTRRFSADRQVISYSAI
jgi:hypothetical protein